MCTFNIIAPIGTYARLRVVSLAFIGPYANMLESAGVAIYNVVNNTSVLVAHLSYIVSENVTFTATEN